MNLLVHENLTHCASHPFPICSGLSNAATMGLLTPPGCSSGTLEEKLRGIEDKMLAKMDNRFKGHEKLRPWDDIEIVCD